ncbi:MAG: alanine racemase [Hyphomonadaceae bacterium]|nr:alanine racemase [Hyphomonadaceae bacterium]
MALPRLHIDLDAIVANWRMFQRRVEPAYAAAVVKANAYGLGADTVAGALSKAGCSRFYVAWPSEGGALRRTLGAAPEITVFHGPTSDTMDVFQMYQLVPVLNHLEQIDLWVSGNISPRPAAMHVDVGMNRLGLSEAHWAAAAKMLPRPSRLLAHLACGDEDSPLNAQQLEIFERASKLWPGAPRSLSATGGAYLGKAYHFDEVRPGIGLYGGGPKPAEGSPSHTVVTLTAPVLQVRDIKKGTTVGYGATWMADADTTLATVGLGYADGFLRSASNRGKAFVAGEKRPIVGRISMDLIVVDVTGLSVSPGDDIEFLGPNMPLSEVAGAMGTIDYEILTRLGSRFERVYVGGA